ncbi:class I mannose-6-phosphate isomerase [Clostridium vincentii]|uniref:Putative mannose-6-phosphate isomerase GmuF n=1 Tax=Clostridium vincentii TaxID=52704 RepID=A0A2T0BI85_9CLOT|nr:class I mannose-6-phosphate isomerase [Clostridium vincentii]PRR83606.1 putative mannose-6-phosphate isomerase GmuF [Clostridium vincentii]
MAFKYDKQPHVEVKGYNNDHDWNGYDDIVSQIKSKLDTISSEKKIVAIDFYPGIRTEEIKSGIVDRLNTELSVYTDEEIFEDISTVEDRIKDDVTEDRVFGKISLDTLEDFINLDSLSKTKEKINNAKGIVVVYGVGINLLVEPDIYIFADLARWEIQQRYRSGNIPNWKGKNYNEDPLRKLKRGYFFEWRVADRYKKRRFDKFDYILDTNLKNKPKMITGEAFRAGLKVTANRPFRVVPFFDPGLWGGQWMKEVCDLDRNMENYAWCFDCVPEENSLLLKVGNTVVEVPSIDVVLTHPRELLGEKVYARFGADFPIRFDLLDTMGGQNLSLQVHPVVEYAQEKFGLHYTQEESYYLLDVKKDKDAFVYLGVKDGITKEKFFCALRKAQDGKGNFNPEEYSNKIQAKKHDHFLIPPGTVHCSGADTMVLEISATPNLFTFKLWDWSRLGMDGKPRPINIAHGEEVVQFDRDTKWTMKNLVNRVEVIDEGDGWIEERTGLHEKEFIETRRHWFTKTVLHNTNDGVNVLNLVEGDQAIVESPTSAFEPFIVNYAETFIIPASIVEYTISPYGDSVGKKIATVKAYVRN